MKFLTVNMEELTTRFLPVSSEYDFLGGRALIGKILASMVPPKANPYGPQSKLIVAPGLLAGTRVPCSGRLSVGGLSPLTGGIKEANSGGTAGHSLARLGIKAVIIEGKPAAGCYVLKIDSKGAELIREDSLAGLKNYETSRRLREAYGEKISLIMAGPAGERKYANSTVAVTDPSGTPSRHAARGGLGGVMAAKGIKAIVIDDKEPTYIKGAPSLTKSARSGARNSSRPARCSAFTARPTWLTLSMNWAAWPPGTSAAAGLKRLTRSMPKSWCR